KPARGGGHHRPGRYSGATRSREHTRQLARPFSVYRLGRGQRDGTESSMTDTTRWQALLRRPAVWLAAAVLVVTAAFAWRSSRGPKVETAAAVRRDLEQHVVASGRVWVPSRVQIAAQLQGLVVAVGANEGQNVRAGDLLVQIDDAEARSAVAQAKAAVDQAKARVEQLRKVGAIVATEGSRQADANLARAVTELGRVERLVASGAAPATQLDDARRNVEVARAQERAAEA